MNKYHVMRQTPMAVKMIVFMLIVGAVVGGILQRIESRDLRNIFMKQLLDTLEYRAVETRNQFDQYLKAQKNSVKILSSHENFNHYLESLSNNNWSAAENPIITYHKTPPEWFPSKEIIREFVRPYYALLIDPSQRVREVFQWTSTPPPQDLISLDNFFFRLVQSQALITRIEDKPFMVSLEEVYDDNDNLQAYVMFAWPIDSNFLKVAQMSFSGGKVMILVEDEVKVIASTNPAVVPEGTLVESLGEDYVFLGKIKERSFFIAGETEMDLRFFSLMPKKEADLITWQVLSIGRKRSMAYGVAFILASVIMIFMFSSRVRGLTKDIGDFLQATLGIEYKAYVSGDELYTLQRSFNHMEEKIIDYRDSINKHMQELREEKDRAQNYLDIAAVMFVAINVQEKVSLINKAGCALLGYKETEIIGRNWFANFIPESDREAAKEVFHAAIRGEVESVKVHENTVLTKKGDEKIIAWHNTVVRDSDGNIVSTLSSGEDITARKKAEHKQRLLVKDLEDMNRLMVGRELKMIELKKEIEELQGDTEAG